MALPKEPRQKMINLMYLVLTALLALNVSAEIVNAFKTIDNSLAGANRIVTQKNDAVYNTFTAKLNDDKTKEKAALWQPKALAAKKLSDDMYNYLEGLKKELKVESKLEIKDGVEVYKEDDLDAATRLLVEGPKAKELYDKLVNYKTNLINVLNPSDFSAPGMEEVRKKVDDARNSFQTSLPLDMSIPKTVSSVNGKTWNAAYFRMTPTVAAITMLSKFQNDVKNSESEVVDFCLRQVSEVVLQYDQFQAIASQSSEYLMPDQELTITGGVGAFSKSAAPTVSIDGSVVPLNAQGVAEQKFKVGGPGAYTKKVRISFKKPDGTDGVVEKEIKYTVGSPTGISVNAVKLNVFYVGLENELMVTGGAGGAETKQVSVSGAGGSISNKGGGRYVVRVTQPGECTVNVNGTPFKFRAKRVPNPIPMVGASEGGPISSNALKAQMGVRAELRDFLFDGVEYNVTGFTLVANGGSLPNMQYIQNSGASFNRETRNILEKCGPGTTVFIDEIKAVGPGGDTRKLPQIVFQLQ